MKAIITRGVRKVELDWNSFADVMSDLNDHNLMRRLGFVDDKEDQLLTLIKRCKLDWRQNGLDHDAMQDIACSLAYDGQIEFLD